MIQMSARVSRGADKGVVLAPHRHSDGCYVVSPTRFEKDYIRVSSLEEVYAHYVNGLNVRMSNKTFAKAPRLISPGSISASVS